MKLLLIVSLLGFMVVSCNDKVADPASNTTDSTKSETASAEQLSYAYALDHPYKDWQPGDQKHAVTAMASLKAFEDGDIATCVSFFGDSITLRFDGFHARVNNDSLKKVFTKSRANIQSTKISMQDWESVISKDKKDEYVTMWYKEVTTDTKGKTDSMAVVDDLKFVNGKIVELDQKIQHFPAGKKM